MGFKKKPKRIRLHFEGDPELDGFEAVLRGVNVGEYLDLMGMGEVDRSSVPEMIRWFARSLISWNLEEEDGTPVPISEEAVFAEDQEFILRLANTWLEAMSGTPAPLDETSTGGEPSPVASIPMEPLSESRAS